MNKKAIFELVKNILYQYIIHIDNSHSYSELKIFINVNNIFNDTKIGDIMDNKSLIDIMSKSEKFNARIISQLYLDISKGFTPFFLYNDNLLNNEIELIALSSIGEIRSTIIDMLDRITHATLKNPENPLFTPIYQIAYQKIFNE